MNDLFTDFSLRKLWLALIAPLRRMALSEPPAGRMPPQPNEDLAVTRAVQRLLGLDSKHGK